MKKARLLLHDSNRTFMELKYNQIQSQIDETIKLQSHLYGIEISLEVPKVALAGRTPIAPLWN